MGEKLSYFGRVPVKRTGGKVVAVARDGQCTTVAVFPWGAWNHELIIPLLMCGFGAVAGGRVLLEPTGHAAALAVKIYIFLCFAFVAVFAGVFAVWSVANAMRQVEFDVRPDGLSMVSFGPLAAKPRHWPREEIAGFRVEPQRNPRVARLVLVTKDGTADELLRSRTVTAQEAAGLLRKSLGFETSGRPVAAD